MTNEEMIQELTDLRDDYITGTLSYDALDQALVRLAVLRTPAPPGSVVRIAVSVSPDGYGNSWLIRPGEDDAWCMTQCRVGCGPSANVKTMTEAIITAHIPPRIVPEVTATVEPCQFDPEATI